MKINTLIAASDLNQLKKQGSFREIKTFIETSIDNKLGITGWNSLYEKLEHLKKGVNSNEINSMYSQSQKSLKQLKKEFSALLTINVTANTLIDLQRKIDLIINFFSSEPFNPFKHYENTKLDKFKNSSKLEGIIINHSNNTNSMEDILRKYRRQNDGQI